MTDARKPLVTLSLGRRELRPLLAAALLLAVPYQLGSETLTLSTTYPSPSGVYNQIVTTGGGGKDSNLARDGGSVVIGKAPVGLAVPVEKLRVHGNAAVTGAASVNSLTVAGNAKIQDLTLHGVTFPNLPNPPAGKKWAWVSLTLPVGTDLDTAAAGNPYNAPSHTDTCNGNASSSFTCSAADNKTCIDVQLVSNAVGATGASCVWGGWNSKAGGMSDTCNDRNYTYDSCTHTCTDVDCTDWAFGECLNRSWRFITYTAGTSGSPAKYRDVTVQCNVATTETIYTLKAQ